MNEIKSVDLSIPLDGAIHLSARLWKPEESQKIKLPTILEYIPYGKSLGTYERDSLNYQFFSSRGYACLRVDLRGSGESNGQLEDEYLKTEQKDCLKVLEWIENQYWSNGKVGMMGISWGGFNALQVAALRPPQLKAIITCCSTDDRYNDDIHYKGGLLLNENFGWASAFQHYLAFPPDRKILGESWKEVWQERLEKLPLFIDKWLSHSLRNDYWKHGSACESYSSINCPTFAIGGWSDSYSNVVKRLYNQLKVPFLGIVGPWAHKYPHMALPGPNIDFLNIATEWWDRWLKGGTFHRQGLYYFCQDSYIPRPKEEYREGRFIKILEDDPGVTFFLKKNQLTKKKQTGSDVVVLKDSAFVGQNSGEFCVIWQGKEWPEKQNQDDSCSLCFDSDILEKDFEVIGPPLFHFKIIPLSVHFRIFVRINDVNEKGDSTRVTYGVLNGNLNKECDEAFNFKKGQIYSYSVLLDEACHKLKKGHKLRLAISTSYSSLFWPSKETIKASLLLHECSLQIPFASYKNVDDGLLSSYDKLESLKSRVLRPSSHSRHFKQTENNNSIHIHNDFGLVYYPEISKENETVSREAYKFAIASTGQAKAKLLWKSKIKMDGKMTALKTYMDFSSDKERFTIFAKQKSYIENDIFYEKSWKWSLKREFYQ
jgi:putative CocE/NonD family hydrolase